MIGAAVLGLLLPPAPLPPLRRAASCSVRIPAPVAQEESPEGKPGYPQGPVAPPSARDQLKA